MDGGENEMVKFKQLPWHSKIAAVLIWLCFLTITGSSIGMVIDIMGWAE